MINRNHSNNSREWGDEKCTVNLQTFELGTIANADEQNSIMKASTLSRDEDTDVKMAGGVCTLVDFALWLALKEKGGGTLAVGSS